MKKIIWISWEDHRRTRELAKELHAKLIIEFSPFKEPLSYLHKAVMTIKHCFYERPDILIVQNPSQILAFIASCLKILLKYKYIVDRHSNFRLAKKIGLNPFALIKVLFSKISLYCADLTIVTNDFLKKIVEHNNGRGFVLPDKIPSMKKENRMGLYGEYKIVLICTYANDEPYEMVIDTMRYFSTSTILYVTGDYKKSKIDKKKIPQNVKLTGFVEQNYYDQLLASADVLVDFTTSEWCLVCGGYEAIALEKPFITSNTIALRQLFGDSVIYAEHTVKDFTDKIRFALDNQERYKALMHNMKLEYGQLWEKKIERLKQNFF